MSRPIDLGPMAITDIERVGAEERYVVDVEGTTTQLQFPSTIDSSNERGQKALAIIRTYNRVSGEKEELIRAFLKKLQAEGRMPRSRRVFLPCPGSGKPNLFPAREVTLKMPFDEVNNEALRILPPLTIRYFDGDRSADQVVYSTQFLGKAPTHVTLNDVMGIKMFGSPSGKASEVCRRKPGVTRAFGISAYDAPKPTRKGK